MGKYTNLAIIYNISVFLIVGVVTFLYYLFEKKNKKKIYDNYIQHEFVTKKKNQRVSERILVPEDLDFMVTLTDPLFFSLKAKVVDISNSGLACKPNFPLKKLPVDIELNNLIMDTPDNSILIKKVKVVRLQHQPDKRILGFHILEIENEESEKLNNIALRLKDFQQSD